MSGLTVCHQDGTTTAIDEETFERIMRAPDALAQIDRVAKTKKLPKKPVDDDFAIRLLLGRDVVVTSETSRWRQAVHEAGHALLGILLGYTWTLATMRPARVTGWEGQDIEPHDDIAMYVASAVAEEIALDQVHFIGPREDFAHALRIAEGIDPVNAVSVIRAEIVRVRGMIREHVRALQDLAEALIDRGQLTYDQAEAIVRKYAPVDLYDVGEPAMATAWELVEVN